MVVDLGGGRYGQRVAAWQAASIGPTDGDWIHGKLTLTMHGTEYATTALSPPVVANYLKVVAQASATDTTPVEVIVRINAAPTESSTTAMNGVGYIVEGVEIIPLDGTAVVTIHVMATNADAAYCRLSLSNAAIT